MTKKQWINLINITDKFDKEKRYDMLKEIIETPFISSFRDYSSFENGEGDVKSLLETYGLYNNFLVIQKIKSIKLIENFLRKVNGHLYNYEYGFRSKLLNGKYYLLWEESFKEAMKINHAESIDELISLSVLPKGNDNNELLLLFIDYNESNQHINKLRFALEFQKIYYYNILHLRLYSGQPNQVKERNNRVWDSKTWNRLAEKALELKNENIINELVKLNTPFAPNKNNIKLLAGKYPNCNCKLKENCKKILHDKLYGHIRFWFIGRINKKDWENYVDISLYIDDVEAISYLLKNPPKDGISQYYKDKIFNY